MSSHWPTADQQPGATPAQAGFMEIGGATLAGAAMRAGLIDEYASSPIRSWWAAARRSSQPWTPG